MRRATLILSLAATSALATPASAQLSFSIDWHGPTVGLPDSATGTPITEGDILVPLAGLAAPGPLPAPVIAITGGPGGLGLALHPGCVGHPGGTPCGIEVDALSFGADFRLSQDAEILPGQLMFSTDEFATGFGPFFPPDLTTESPVGDSSSDTWVNVGPLPPAPAPPFAVPGGHTGVFDGDGLPSGSGFVYPGVGLIEPNLPGTPPDTGDNLDALDVGTAAGIIGPVFFSLDSFLFDPLAGVPNSGSAPAHGFTGADVLVTPFPGALPVVYAPGPALGLNIAAFANDDLDALIIAENGIPGYQPSVLPYDWTFAGTDMLVFSVRRGSAVIGMPDSLLGIPIEEGDVLTVPVPTALGGVSPFPAILIAAENLGLATARSMGVPFGDDLNALDALFNPFFDCNSNGIEDSVDIANGTSSDVNMNGIPDECESFVSGYCFCAAGAPCGNVDASAGCLNSTGSGALLSSTGSTSVLLDDLIMTASSLPPFAFGLLYRGTLAAPPAPFGDGQRCVGGILNRFPVQGATAAGTISEGPGLAAAYGFVPLQTIFVQAWYRDGAGPCGSGFNFSSALLVTFIP